MKGLAREKGERERERERDREREREHNCISITDTYNVYLHCIHTYNTHNRYLQH